MATGNLRIKSFDYDGAKYTPNDCARLVARLETESVQVKEEIRRNDHNIYQYFLSLAKNQGKEERLKAHYQSFFAMDKAYDSKFNVYVKLINATDFIHQTTPFEAIEQNLVTLKGIEKEFKQETALFLQEEIFQSEITEEMKDCFQNYLSRDLVYFSRPDYDSSELNILFTSINHYQLVLAKTYFKVKKALLDYQVGLEENQETSQNSTRAQLGTMAH
jgi:hypothetical protein